MFRTLILVATLALGGCMSPPVDLDLSRERATVDHRYAVKVRPMGEPIALGKLHSWEVSVRQPSGQPVTGARFAVDGGMPQHHHGLPTQPQVTRELGDGRYLLEGVKFSMSGWWELKLKIDAAPGPDKVTFNLVLP
ncbi:FixH family protein [Pseudoduganella sp. OTU4001]|uniref:FixH family protein n=1 Tax=Pseudoduganella sp. OTU4001 TaxID=3043854 RepID=UPI00313E79D2